MAGVGGIGTGEVLLTSAFVAYETQFGFSQFLPSIMTIGTFVDSADKVRMIREGELVAAAFAVIFAGLFSMITGSWLPITLSAVAISMTVLVYEWALRRAPGWGAH